MEGLTLEQQFQYRLMVQQSPSLTDEQIRVLLVQAKRLELVKDNVIKQLEGEK